MTLTIIGYGNVGRALSLVLLGSEYEFRLNIMDPDERKKGVFLDLKHGIMAQPKKRLCFNDFELLEESDFIFFTVGVPTKHAAFEIRKTEYGTSMGVVQCALRVMDYWINEEDSMIPLCVKLNDYWLKLLGLNKSVCMSIPVNISKKGVFPYNAIDLSFEELDQLKQSAKILSEYEVL